MTMRCTRGRLAAIAAACAIAGTAHADGTLGSVLLFANESGLSATYDASGSIAASNPFFQRLGSNGRSCSSCHQPSDGWSVTPSSIRRRFDASDGLDPIFRPSDGAVSPNADVSTADARRKAYALLLAKGLIRIGIGIPDNAEFELVDVDDPYGYASARELSLFRRPLPAANVKFLSTIMWDGRETLADASSTDCVAGTATCFASLDFDLGDQANTATLGHAQAAQPLSPAQRDAIARFEQGLFSAQVFDRDAKRLTAFDARGGPRALAAAPFYFGINDAVAGDYRTRAPFEPRAFRLYDAWSDGGASRTDGAATREARAAVLRGQRLFNTKPIRITGVSGLNDELRAPVVDGHCTTCHDTPDAGSHSIPAPLDIGVADAARATPDLPIYTLRNKATGAIVETTDPGRALVTGKWKDIGRFKGPNLRGLAARPPYFHNGSAADLRAVVEFYDRRFGIGLADREKADLVAFLRAL